MGVLPGGARWPEFGGRILTCGSLLIVRCALIKLVSMKTRRLRPVIVAAASFSLFCLAAPPVSFAWEFGSHLSSPGSDAQTTPVAHPMPEAMLAGRLSHLTLDDAVELCLHRNPDILRQLQEIQRLQGLVIQVRAAAIPHLIATGTFEQEDRSLIQTQTGTSGGTISGIPLLEPANFGTPVDLNSIFNQVFSGSANEPDKNYNITIESHADALQCRHPAANPAGAFPAQRRLLRIAGSRRYRGQHGQDGLLHGSAQSGLDHHQRAEPASARKPASGSAKPFPGRDGTAF